MNANQYQCASCHGIFDKPQPEVWDDNKAKTELVNEFGNIPTEHCDVVCDDCYKELMAWNAKNQSTN